MYKPDRGGPISVGKKIELLSPLIRLDIREKPRVSTGETSKGGTH